MDKIRKHKSEYPEAFQMFKRNKYLTEQISNLKDELLYLLEMEKYCFEINEIMESWLYQRKAEILEKKIMRYEMEKGRLSDAIGRSFDERAKEQARAVPFETILDFTRGRCACPIHEGNNPTSMVLLDENRVYCHVCGKSWDTIQFVMDRDNLSYLKAIKYLLSNNVEQNQPESNI